MIKCQDNPSKTRSIVSPARGSLVRQLSALALLSYFFTGFNVAQAQAPVSAPAQDQQMMVRMSEIQVDAKYLAQYNAILKEEAEASVRLEPGVIAIFPMYQRDNATEIRILEMYANRAAYEAHLKTPHFLKYKTETLKMVKSLKLIDMQTIDAATMSKMFTKMKRP